jgi:hemolysin D
MKLLRKLSGFWKNRKYLNDKRYAKQAAIHFLPGALEISEKPPNPLSRVMLWLVIVIICVAVAWACLGKVDVVVMAQGKIVPEEQVKIIQPLEKGTVRKIFVKDGQLVDKGAHLIELDQSVIQANIDRLNKQLQSEQIILAESEGFYKLLQRKSLKSFDDFAEIPYTIKTDIDPAMTEYSRRVLWRKWQAYVAEMQSLKANIAKEESTLQAAMSEISLLEKTVPIIRLKNHMLKELHSNNYASKFEYLQTEQSLIEKEKLLEITRVKQQQSQAMLDEAKSQLKARQADYFVQVIEVIQKTKKAVYQLKKELYQQQMHYRDNILIAPITGFVHNLKIHTIGAVVTPAEELLQIIPQHSALEVSAIVTNRDIGYVHEGQAVAIKVDTFSFTEYGYLHGKIIDIAEDAIEDNTLGLVFKIIVSLNSNTLSGTKEAIVTPGMSVTIEVKTHKRRMIEYFLNPLIKGLKESFKER